MTPLRDEHNWLPLAWPGRAARHSGGRPGVCKVHIGNMHVLGGFQTWSYRQGTGWIKGRQRGRGGGGPGVASGVNDTNPPAVGVMGERAGWAAILSRELGRFDRRRAPQRTDLRKERSLV